MREFLLKILLFLNFKRRVYISENSQTELRINLVLHFDDTFVLINQNDFAQFPVLVPNLAEKHSLVSYIKIFLKEKISIKIHTNIHLDLYYLSFNRTLENNVLETKKVIDDIYLKLNLSGFIESCDLNKELSVLTKKEAKLLLFKNKLNTIDYKLMLAADTQKGILLK
jgi:hypothetical protein